MAARTPNPTAAAVVADAGPLITLEKVRGGFGILPGLFGRLVVPRPVMDELALSRVHPGEAAFTAALGLPVDVVDPGELLVPPPDLSIDRGELAAVSVAARMRVAVLLEDKDPRVFCDRIGVRYVGAAGLAVAASYRGVLGKAEAAGLIAQMWEARRLDPRTYRLALDAVEGGKPKA
ncbi:MAG: hypothetical protein HY928_06755 [Elusimicrobia bacterium]|nr:hypothetical protein [Elusimicrobiota bacterium]